MSTRVLLADDHEMIREGLRSLLEKQADLEVVGEAEDGHAAVRLVQKLHPNVVVLDVAMPGLNGVEAARQITAKHPHVKIIALSMHEDRRYVSEMLKAGASGYLLKGGAFRELVEAVRAVMKDRIYLTPAVARTVVDEYRRGAGEEAKSAFAVLTEREREVLQLLAEGKSAKEIAGVLALSVKTVGTHREHIMEKLNLRSLAELTKYAIREGLTSL
ncbi:MAG: response regulator transcription factor [Kiritimatiellae bacterium]|nr:response regulator transcription factor [Kiritimatiellia bacterium]